MGGGQVVVHVWVPGSRTLTWHFFSSFSLFLPTNPNLPQFPVSWNGCGTHVDNKVFNA